MASGNLVNNISDEVTCSLCLERFKDPVTVDCGHNFCQVCITQCLEEAEGQPSCPQCRETISQRNFRPNCQLANLVELIKRLQLEIQEEEKRGVSGKYQTPLLISFCGKHQEPLKLFCKDDQMCICLVCHLSKEHKDHNVLPVEEASQEYKVRNPCERSKGLAAFETLERNKLVWLSCLDDLQKQMKEYWEENDVELLDKITDLRSQIVEMEKMCQKPAGEFLQQGPGGLFLDVTAIKEFQNLPFNPERFDTMPCVLGREKFTAGRHYWDVEIKENQAGWAVGVARESVRRKGYLKFSPEEGIWAIHYFRILEKPLFQLSALTSPSQIKLSSSQPLSKVRVSLDYEAGHVEFSDPCSGGSIFTFSSACFAGERVCPFFQVSQGTTLNCCRVSKEFTFSFLPKGEKVMEISKVRDKL
uniref:RING-type E3 ubiquitin transferase n=1 Tax=Salvator merianae TaxID=96440 RepID=A0A8D0BPK3_SALMN